MIGCDTGMPFESRWGDLIPAGAWSDDTSMAVAAMESIIAQKGEIDHDDIMSHSISKMGCVVYTVFLKELLSAESVDAAWERTRQIDYATYYGSEALEAYQVLLSDKFLKAGDDVIGETRYVADSLMAAVYSMLHGKSYEEAVLCAINLGYDTDTNAAIAGALAGAYYGESAIPDRWLNKLRKREYLEELSERFAYTQS